MNCIVTGAAGFIGSHLCSRLLEEGFDVVGIDSFTDFYPKWMKEKNIAPLLTKKRFRFFAEDLNNSDLDRFLKDTEIIFHLAAQPGVRSSWGDDFHLYTKNNIEATQRLLEATKKSRVKKFIFASSSSVYGMCPELPMRESSPLLPFSPYGVTKLAAEHLCHLYSKNYGVPIISLRFFTVYGPGQRPDMAFHRFFCHILERKPIHIFGDGQQTRDFTYIDDIIEANLLSLKKGKVGEIYNIGGGNQETLKNILPLLEEISRTKISVEWRAAQKGDVLHTQAEITKSKRDLGFVPQTQLADGLKEEWKWIRRLYSQK